MPLYFLSKAEVLPHTTLKEKALQYSVQWLTGCSGKEERIVNMKDSGRKIKKFENCTLLRGDKIIKEHLWVRGGKIINPEPLFFDEKLGPDEIIDENQDAILYSGIAIIVIMVRVIYWELC